MRARAYGSRSEMRAQLHTLPGTTALGEDSIARWVVHNGINTAEALLGRLGRLGRLQERSGFEIFWRTATHARRRGESGCDQHRVLDPHSLLLSLAATSRTATYRQVCSGSRPACGLYAANGPVCRPTVFADGITPCRAMWLDSASALAACDSGPGAVVGSNEICTWRRNLTTYEWWSVGLGAAALTLNGGVFGLLFWQLTLLGRQVSDSGKSLTLATKEAATEHERQRQQATLDFIGATIEKQHELFGKLKTILSS